MRAVSQLEWLEPKSNVSSVADRSTWLPICLVLAAAVVLRIPNLTESLWFDELWSTHLMLGSLRALAVSVINDVHPPFYLFFMFVWINLFGDSELSVRLPPLLFGIASIFLTYLLALKLTDRRTALLTSLLLSLSPVHIWYSQEARQYSALLFLVLASIYSFYRIQETDGKPSWFWIYAASVTAAVFTHYYALAFLFTSCVLCLFGKARLRSRVLFLNLSILGFLAFYLVAKALVRGVDTSSSYLQSFTPLDLWQLFFNWYAFGNSLWQVPRTFDLSIVRQNPVMVLVLAVIVFLFIRGVKLLAVGDFREKSESSSHSYHVLIYLFAVPLLLLGLTLLGFKNFYVERSTFVGLPFFYLVLAIGSMHFKVRHFAIVAMCFLMGLSTITFYAYLRKSDVWTVYKPNADWRAAASYFDRDFKDSSEPVLVFAPTPAMELLYYHPGFAEFTAVQEQAQPAGRESNRVKRLVKELLPERLWRGPKVDPNQIKAQLYELNEQEDVYALLTKQHIKTFYLISNKYWTGSSLRCLEQIRNDGRMRLLDQESFKGLTVYKFEV